MHVHENFAVDEIESGAERVRCEFQRLVEREDGDEGDVGGWTAGARVVVEHVERVKSYAPGVIHCVVDLCIEPGG